MNILIVSPYAINTPHFETELEIAQNLLDGGNNVDMLNCNADLLACDVNPTHNILKCYQCINKRKKGVKLLSPNIDTFPLIKTTAENIKEFTNIKKTFANVEELKKYTIDNFDIGYAVLSSLVSFTRDPYPDTMKHRELIHRFILSAIAIYRSISNYLEMRNYDGVYVYNGRYAPMRAVLRACQKNKVDCSLIERGSSLNLYAIYINKLPHDMNYRTSLVNNCWTKEKNLKKKEKLASEFYSNKIENISPNWIAYTKNQKENLLPQNWDNQKDNIAIYISSEDEFVAIGDMWCNTIYNDQLDGLNQIIASLENDQDIHIYLRVHPNLKNVKNTQTQEIKKLKAKNLTVIPANSPVSTYALMRNAAKILTFGSTVGIEAAFWGVPSILAGPSAYQNLGCTYNPNSHQEVIDLLRADLSPKDREGAIVYGYYAQTFGTPFNYYKPLGIKRGKFKGVNLRKNRFLLGLYALSLTIPPIDKLICSWAVLLLQRKIFKQT